MLWNDEVCAEPQLWWWKWTPLLMERRPLRSMILTLACTATCVVDIHLSQRSPCCYMSGKLCGSMLLTDFFSLHLAMQRMWFLACEVSLRQFSVGVQAVSQCERQNCWKSYNKVIVSQTQTIGVETSFLLAELILTLPFRYIEVEKFEDKHGWMKEVCDVVNDSIPEARRFLPLLFFLYSHCREKMWWLPSSHSTCICRFFLHCCSAAFVDFVVLAQYFSQCNPY